jgi:hypothetical protein
MGTFPSSFQNKRISSSLLPERRCLCYTAYNVRALSEVNGDNGRVVETCGEFISSMASNTQSSSRAPTFPWWFSPHYPANSGQQMLIASGPEQVSGSPQTTTSQIGQVLRPFLLIGMVVVKLLLVVGVGSTCYNSGQQNGSKPGTTPTPGFTSTPTRTPNITPTLTAFQVTATGITEHRLTIVKTASLSVPIVVYSRDEACPRLCSFKRT